SNGVARSSAFMRSASISARSRVNAELQTWLEGIFGYFHTLGCLDEIADFSVILLPGRRFHATGNIHGIGLNLPYSLRDIRSRQSACEKNRSPKFLCLDGEVPIEFFARATEFVRDESIEQKCFGGIFRQSRQRAGVTHAKRFHAHQPELRAILRRFVPV